MKHKRHSAEQIIAKLRQAGAILAIGQVCQQPDVSEQTFRHHSTRLP